MWVDENDVIHTVWVPPEAVLGGHAVAALRAVPADQAEAALDEINGHYDRVRESARADAPTHPAAFGQDNVDDLPYPPVFPGLTPQPEESLATTVLRFVDGIPGEWRLEALEAVCDVLEPYEADDEL